MNSIVMDLEKFDDPAEDLKAIVRILESEEWALGE
jgi:exonuclease VII small subunit